MDYEDSVFHIVDSYGSFPPTLEDYRCTIARCRLRLSAFLVSSWLLAKFLFGSCCYVWLLSLARNAYGLSERTRKFLTRLSTIKSIRLFGLNPCYSLRRFPDGGWERLNRLCCWQSRFLVNNKYEREHQMKGHAESL
jgi:hypothetical protein